MEDQAKPKYRVPVDKLSKRLKDNAAPKDLFQCRIYENEIETDGKKNFLC